MFGRKKRVDGAKLLLETLEALKLADKRARDLETKLADSERDHDHTRRALLESQKLAQQRFNVWRETEKEVSLLRAKVALSKPLRDKAGHFISRKEAVMPEVANRDCSFVVNGVKG